jgi:hypothetical protein
MCLQTLGDMVEMMSFFLHPKEGKNGSFDSCSYQLTTKKIISEYCGKRRAGHSCLAVLLIMVVYGNINIQLCFR